MTASKNGAATGDAGSILCEACEAVSDAAAASGSGQTAGEVRTAFVDPMFVLATYVAEGDGALTAVEEFALGDVFWLARPSDTGRAAAAALAQTPELVSAAVSEVARFALLTVAHGTPAQPREPERHLLYRAAEQVFATVLAHDGIVQPEVGRLNEVTAKLRQAIADQVATLPPPAEAPPAGPSLASTMADLDRLVGLATVKREVATLTSLAKVFQIRRNMALPVPDMSFHLVFQGNPGTGKTSVARIVAQLYGELGLLSKGQLVETDRSGLVASYIGQTATKVGAVVQSAMGGVLFIDEAYALDGGSDSDYGHEAVATLIKAMEDHRSDLVVIAAGYTEQMQRFLDINPGIRSRIGRTITFPDYSPAEMVAIFCGMADQAGFLLPHDALPQLSAACQQLWDRRGKDFANARDVRNLFERVVEAQASRVCTLATPTEADVKTVTAEDLAAGLGQAGPDRASPALAENKR